MGRRLHGLHAITGLFVLCLVLGGIIGCGAGQTASIQPDYAEALRDYSPFYLHWALSPNGRWIAKVVYESTESPYIEISDVMSGETLIHHSLPEGDLYASPQGWAPDNSAVAFASAQRGCQGCPFNRLLIAESHPSDSPIHTYAFPFPEEQGNIVLQWSPEAERVVLWSNWTSVLILDREAHLVGEFQPSHCGLNKRLVGEARMIDSQTLLVVIIPSFSEPVSTTDPMASELLLVQGEKFDQCRRLYHSEESLMIVAINPTQHLLLLNEGNFGEATPTFLQIVDIERGEIAKTLEIAGMVTATSSHSRWIALQVDRPLPEEDSLLLFDWQRQELKDSGTVWGLVGWRDNIGGFLVARQPKKTEEAVHFEVVRP